MVTIYLETHIHAPLERCFDLALSIEAHLAGTEGTGEAAVGGITSGLMRPGDEVRWRARHFGVWQHLTSKITAYDRPCFFQDTMVQGAFRSMQHDHTFQAKADGSTLMTDEFRFTAPLTVLGRIAEVLVLRRYMTVFLQERNRALKEIAESDRWRHFLPSSA